MTTPAAVDQSREKPPRLILGTKDTHPSGAIYAFPPNRETLGGTAYLIVEEVKILIDCPAWNPTNQAFLTEQGGIDWLVLTHRGGHAQVRDWQERFNCRVLVQEQEAYLLPGLSVTPFQEEFQLTPRTQAMWTSGHSPGSACLYYQGWGGVLFSGRHLLPTPQGQLAPIQTAKTFHWPRQLRSRDRLRQTFNPDTLQYICPGANIGFLRGNYYVESGYAALMS